MAYFFKMVRIYTNKIQYFVFISMILHILFFVAWSSFAYLSKDYRELDVFLINEISTSSKGDFNKSKTLSEKQRTHYEMTKIKHNKEESSKSLTFDTPVIMEDSTKGSVSFIATKTEGNGSETKIAKEGYTTNRIIDTEFGTANGPKFAHREMPVYPQIARRLGKEGRVVFRLTINEKGELEDIEVLETAPYGFVDSAMEAIKKSKFYPAMKDGKPVACRAILPVRFVLQ